MKKKDKKKPTKKEISRPSHKKPRPKKYVEAKIPNLPPVPSETIQVKKEALCTLHLHATKSPCLDCIKSETQRKKVIIELELPEGHTEETFKNKVLTAVEQLQTIVNAQQKQIEDEKASMPPRPTKGKYAGCVVYTHPGIGMIKRRDFPEGTNLVKIYADMLNEERSENGWSANYEWLDGSWKRIKPIESYTPPPPAAAKKPWYYWFSKLIGR